MQKTKPAVIIFYAVFSLFIIYKPSFSQEPGVIPPANETTNEKRISKEKMFKVTGEAELIIKADKMHIYAYVMSDDVVYSEDSMQAGEMKSIESANKKMELFSSNLKRSKFGLLPFTLTPIHDPETVVSTEIAAITQYDDNGNFVDKPPMTPTFVETGSGVWSATAKPSGVQVFYHFTAKQRVVITTSICNISEAAKAIVLSGGSFTPANVLMNPTTVYSTIFSGIKLTMTGQTPDPRKRIGAEVKYTFSPMKDKSLEKDEAMAAGYKSTAQITDYNDLYGIQGPLEYVNYSIYKESKQEYEAALLKLAIADARETADQIIRSLGVKLEKIDPLAENTFSYTAKKDYSGNIILKAKVILYY